jgi:PAS domain S-box-containing protein
MGSAGSTTDFEGKSRRHRGDDRVSTRQGWRPGDDGDRVAVLEMLVAQAAIALEHAGLHGSLKKQLKNVRLLVESDVIGISIGHLDGRISGANEAFFRIVGYDQADLESGRLDRSKLTPVEWRDLDARVVAEMMSTGRARPHEKEYLRKDGSRVPVLVGAARFNKRGAVVAFIIDLTDRKRAEAAARESEPRYREMQMELAHANRVATMGQLAASIAHEVSQPLAAILTNAGTAERWLASESPNLERARQLIAHVTADAKRATDIVSGIHGLVKKTPFQKGDLAINEVILEVIALTRGAWSKDGVLVRTELSEDQPLIQGDRVQLQQVILNLIVNAVEAMSQMDDSQRLMVISAESDRDSVQIKVSDSGPGLPEDGIEQVFEAFYTTKPTGLGMGLSICRSIVEAHGGRLWALPNEPRGTVFCMTLPR